jgi:hypothetical protein
MKIDVDGFISGVVLTILEKILTFGLDDLEGFLKQWLARIQQQKVDQSNISNLHKTEVSNDQKAVDQAGEDLLNGTPHD